ncbi:MAG: FGGY-family carbohydrate kinase [Rhodospirillales bacterium]|nr:FGGY-family carbohydrate kinase [Rhodospirillales bacterium]
MALLLGLDIGTTSTIGILIDTEGGIRATASRPSELVSKHPNWAEEDPALWWDNVCTLVPELLKSSGSAASDIVGIGVTGMVPTVILLGASGRPLRFSIQQNDARAVDEIEEMKRAIDPDVFFRRTGGSINQQLVAPKLRWLERNQPDHFKHAKTVLGSYDYITGWLTGAFSVEQNWALESGFMDLGGVHLDEDLVALGGISLENLPPLRASHELAGEVTPAAAAQTGLSAGTPVVAGCADHIASAFVAGASQDGDLVVKFGGAGDIMLSCSSAVTDRRLFIDFHIVPGLFFSNGCMAASGSVLNWIARHLAKAETMEAEALGLSVHALLDQRAGDLPAGAGGVVLLPYFLGEKTPLHDPHARGTLVGLGLHHGLPHIWRAALEAVAFGFRHHTEVFAEIGLATRRVLACDGGAASDLWLQITADVLKQPVQRLLNHPGSCLGAAFVAGMGVGALEDWSAISRYVQSDRTFEPDVARGEVYDEAYGIYRDLYERLRSLYPQISKLPT